MIQDQYAIFKLGDERYGVDILSVNGISEMLHINKVPNRGGCLEGLMNLRGDVIPVVNLKKKFKYDDVSYKSSCRIILINIKGIQIGFMVDDTSQVRVFDNDSIEGIPSMIISKDRNYIKAIGKHDGKIYILLDVENLITLSEENEISELLSNG